MLFLFVFIITRYMSRMRSWA